jgi:hypothetical protein
MSIKIPYMRKKISTLLAFTAIALLLLAASPMLFFNPLLLQPAQAQTTFTFKTPTPSKGYSEDLGNVTLTFQGHGNLSSSGELHSVTGDFEIHNYIKGSIDDGSLQNYNGELGLTLDAQGGSDPENPYFFDLDTECGDSASSGFSGPNIGAITFKGPVECSPSSISSPMTGTANDSDGDGIPDSSDKCPHNSNHRCFKEGDTGTTTHDQQQPSSSSSGNQTG